MDDAEATFTDPAVGGVMLARLVASTERAGLDVLSAGAAPSSRAQCSRSQGRSSSSAIWRVLRSAKPPAHCSVSDAAGARRAWRAAMRWLSEVSQRLISQLCDDDPRAMM